jgi:hypothetical protein
LLPELWLACGVPLSKGVEGRLAAAFGGDQADTVQIGVELFESNVVQR